MKPNEVHVWRQEVRSQQDGAAARDLALLDASERRRAASFRRAADRDRYVASHAFLRRVLSRYVGVPPEKLQLAAGRHGKPALTYPAAAPAFNLSHSGSVALVALGGGAAVGVDVEQARNELDVLGLARSVLSKEELAILTASDSALHHTLFYRAWVSKEAVLKACGAGLSIAPERVTVLERAFPDNPCASPIEVQGGAWDVRMLDIETERYFAAVAAPSGDGVTSPDVILRLGEP